MRMRDLEMRIAQARREVDVRFEGPARQTWREAAQEGITHLALALLDELKQEAEGRGEYYARQLKQAEGVRIDE